MDQILGFFSNATSVHIYGMIVLILLAGSMGFPFPEDMTFLATGYVAYRGWIDPNIGLVVGFIGVLIGDSLIYFLGNKLGPKIFAIPILNKLVTAQTLEKGKGLLHNHGSKFIFVSKFIIGLRYTVFFTSGMVSVGYGRFILFDALASSISVPLLIYLTYIHGGKIDSVIASVRHVEYVLLGLFLLAVAFFVIKNYFKKVDNSFAE
jgi:membrane protein DedA with SNARE-associated domain